MVCSVVICTYNRLEYLKKCIASLLKLNFSEHEIIIVNDGSTDGTKTYLESLQNSRIKTVHHETNKGLSLSRNTGIKNASGDIIAFTDDDCEVDQNWLTELMKGFTDENVGLVSGQVYYINKNYQGYFPERLISNPNAKWPMGANVAYQKKVFETCGDFDNFYFEYNNEDSEMAIRAVSQGFLFRRCPDAIVYHQAMDWTVASLLRSAKNASVWPLLKKKYPNHYLFFGPPIKKGLIVNAEDYLYILTAPIFIPLLFIRYLLHGKRNVKIFFTKWPLYLFLRRFYIYKSAILNKVLLF